MTPKQKLKSIEKKMQRIEDKVPNIEAMMRFRADIEEYHTLWFEHFTIKWNLEHCQTCGKKL